MDQTTRQHIDNLRSNDPNQSYASFQYIIKLTQQPVDRADDVWDDLLVLLKSKDNHERASAAQVLSNLAKNDQKRMLKDLDKLMAVTMDERFVTARHSVQSLWKVGATSKYLQNKVVDRLSKRFRDCTTEKNCTLIRYYIIQVYRRVCDQLHDEKIKDYLGLWKDLVKGKK